jgi:hypothetical protein
MSDGRHVTDYRPSCFVHTLISQQNNLNNSYQQRLFLQRNAEKFQALNAQYFAAKAGCSLPCKHVDPNGHDSYWSAYKASLLK